MVVAYIVRHLAGSNFGSAEADVEVSVRCQESNIGLLCRNMVVASMPTNTRPGTGMAAKRVRDLCWR